MTGIKKYKSFAVWTKLKDVSEDEHFSEDDA